MVDSWRQRCGACALAALTAAAGLAAQPALAGDVADAARRAEDAAARGDTAAAIGAFEDATAALWDALPLQLHVATFAEAASVTGYGQYTPAADRFGTGDVMTLYVEPVGYGFLGAGDDHVIHLRTAIDIRSPGGIVYASAPDFGALRWRGRTASRQMYGAVSVKLPELKPGSYEIALTVRDVASGKATSRVLPFAIEDGVSGSAATP